MTPNDNHQSLENALNHHASIAAMIAILVMGPMFFLVMPLYVGVLIDHLHFTNQQVGTITSLELLAAALASIGAFFWIRRVNWRHIAFASAVGLIISNIASLLAGSEVDLLIAIRMLAGFSAGSLLAVGVAAIGDTQRLDRNFSFAIAGQLVLAGVLLLTLPYAIERWQINAIFTTFLVAACCSLLAVFWLPTGGKKHKAQAHTPQQNTWLPLWGLMGSTAFFIAQTSVWAFIERIGITANLSPAFIGTVLGVATIASIGAALSAGYLVERFGRLTIMAAAAFGELICLAGISSDASSSIYFAAVFFYSLCWNLWVPIQMSTIAAVDSSGRFTVLISLFQTLGIAIGPAMVALFLTDNNYLPVNIIGAVFAILALLLFTPILRARSLESNPQACTP